MRGRDGREGPLHPRTRDGARRARARGGKAIVLINRRGWSPHLSCRSCGRAWGCPRCDVSLVVHRAGERPALPPLRPRRARCPRPAPSCGSVTLARAGAGSERIEEEIASAAAPLPVFRLDSDTGARRGRPPGDPRALPGAPSPASSSAPRWSPRATTSPTSCSASSSTPTRPCASPTSAPRSGPSRSSPSSPGAAAAASAAAGCWSRRWRRRRRRSRHAARHDAAGFLAGELERRRELGYPPFSHLIRIELSDPDAERLQRAIAGLRTALDAALPAGAVALGPAPRFRLRGRERRQLLVKAPDRAAAVAAVRETVARRGPGPAAARAHGLGRRRRPVAAASKLESDVSEVDRTETSVEPEARPRSRRPRTGSSATPSASAAPPRSPRCSPSAIRCCARAPRR